MASSSTADDQGFGAWGLVEACAVVEGSSRYRWKWQKANVSRGSGIYGESSKEQVTKAHRRWTDPGLAQTIGRRNAAMDRQPLQLAYSRALCQAPSGEGQGVIEVPLAPRSVARRKDEVEYLEATEILCQQ